MEEKQRNPEQNPQETQPEKHIMTDEELAASIYENDARVLTDDELQETILEDSNLNAFQKCIARMDDRKWKLCQRIVGALLGVLCAVALFWETITGGNADAAATQESAFSYSLIIAIAIAMLIPNIIERQGQRKAPQMRVALAVSLAVVLVIYVICMVAGVVV